MSSDNKDRGAKPLGQIRLDLSRIQDFTDPSSVCRPTTIRRYSNGAKQLYYINASHTGDPDSPTHRAIEFAINSCAPQRIVIEANADRPLPEQSEIAYANSIASQNGISVIRAEPPDDQILKRLQAETTYSVKDLMALYLLRTIPQASRCAEQTLTVGQMNPVQPMSQEELRDHGQAYLANNPAFASIARQDRLTYDEFVRNYSPKLAGKSLTEVTTNDFAPYCFDGATFFQKLNATIGRIREEYINLTVANCLSEPGVDRVLVVYGGGHRTISDSLWEDALGTGIDLPSAEASPGKPQWARIARRAWLPTPLRTNSTSSPPTRGGGRSTS